LGSSGGRLGFSVDESRWAARYRLLHVAARLVRTARRTDLLIAQMMNLDPRPLRTAFARLDAMPRPSS
jgi:hypothetical protein